MNDAPRLRLDSGADRPLDVRRAVVRQALGRLWDVELLVLADSPSLDFEAIVGQPARFAYDGWNGEVAWPGFCSTVGLVAAETDGLSTYQLRVGPRFFFASLDRKSRILQDKSAPDIAVLLLAEWGTEATLELTETYEPLEYRVQYRESTFRFFCRVLEEAGITFHFRADGNMVLTDAPEALPPGPAVGFAPNVPWSEPNMARDVRYARKAMPGRYSMVDHDITRPADFNFEQSEAASLATIESQIERAHYAPGAFLHASGSAARHDEARGQRLVRDRLAAKRRKAQEVTFETTQYDLRPGETLHMQAHPHEYLQESNKLLVTESVLRLSHDDTWTNRVDVVRADRPYRPPLSTPRPKADGLEHATVVGPPGEEIHTDERGRLKVHFHWDRDGRRDGQDTCWVQLVQAWSGPGFGAAHLPRIGHEVIVEFIGGDPERPIVTGTVYTGPNPTAVGLPDNKTVSGFRTQSTNGTGGSNHLLFEDQAGREVLSTRAQRDQRGVVNRVMSEAVGMLKSELTGRVRNAVVGLFSNESVGIAKSIEAGSLIKLHVGTSIIAIEPERITISADLVQVIGEPIKLN
ncbi:MAG: type VI secretion system tip protein TssI/VgrG [Myxococcota bacterium]